MRIVGFSLWTKNTGLKEQEAAHAKHGVTTVYVAGRDDSKLEKRNAILKSLRKGDGISVLGLHCLATGKADLRWALTGEDKDSRYLGIFLREAFVWCYEPVARLNDMPQIEAVLSATEWWAQEAIRRPHGENVKIGVESGGRPRFNRMPVVDALPIWKRPGTKEEVLAEINRISRKLGFREYRHKTAYKYLGPRSDLRAKPNGSDDE